MFQQSHLPINDKNDPFLVLIVKSISSCSIYIHKNQTECMQKEEID